jgi:hypothetical protein
MTPAVKIINKAEEEEIDEETEVEDVGEGTEVVATLITETVKL